MTVIIAALIVALGALDCWLTASVLRAGGREANPAMAFLQDRLPFSWEFVKVAVHGAVAVVVLSYDWAFWGGIIFTLIYLWVCYHNVKVLRGIE